MIYTYTVNFCLLFCWRFRFTLSKSYFYYWFYFSIFSLIVILTFTFPLFWSNISDRVNCFVFYIIISFFVKENFAKFESNIFDAVFHNTPVTPPPPTPRIHDIYWTYRRHLLNVLCTFKLCPMARGKSPWLDYIKSHLKLLDIRLRYWQSNTFIL